MKKSKFTVALFSISCFLFFSTLLNAQINKDEVSPIHNSVLSGKAYSDIKKTYNLLKITPQKLIGFSGSKLALSWEIACDKRFSTQLKGTHYFSEILWFNSESINEDLLVVKGYDFGVEQKFYVDTDAPKGAYISLELNYANLNKNRIEWFGATSYLDSLAYQDTIRVFKQRITANFKMGYQFNLKNIVIDFYTGFGIRYRTVKHGERINPEDEMAASRPLIFYPLSRLNREGRYWGINFPLNFSVGWAF